MNESRRTSISKFLSLVLRHSPETVGISLDAQGWVGVDELLAACGQHGRSISRAELDEVVAISPIAMIAAPAPMTRFTVASSFPGQRYALADVQQSIVTRPRS